MEELIPIVMFMVIGAVVSLVLYLRYRTRRDLQETIRTAVDRGTELSPEVLNALSTSISQTNDLRRGVIAIALGVGFFVFGQVVGEPDAEQPMMAIATFPFLIGLAYLGLHFTNRKD